MISKKMKYALKALIHIANKTEEYVQANEIARQGNIPKKFLEQILLELKKGRIIGSKQGNVGGYYFIKDPQKVTLADVYRLIDGPIALVQCASKNFYEPCADCISEDACIIRHVLIDVRDETLRVLEKRTIDSLAKAEINNSSMTWSI
jgi:Rrf2 family protein